MVNLTIRNAKVMARNFLSLRGPARDLGRMNNPPVYKTVLRILDSYIGPDKEVRELYNELRYGVNNG